MPRLLMIAPAPVMVNGDTVVIDVKFAEGMLAQSRAWDGPVDCILWEGAEKIAFPFETERSALPWRLITLPKGSAIPPEAGQSHDLISASADMAETLDLAGPGRPPVVYSIEYTHQTRIDILALDQNIGALRRLRRRLWLERQERRRRSALKAAAAVQSNGYPGARAYKDLTQDMHVYLDNRMTLDRYATDADCAARLERLSGSGPLRLVYSGRLDPMKGAQDLVPIACRLASQHFSFEFDIFGDGILRAEMAAAIAANGLGDKVRLHGNVDFANELVPWQRTTADLFVSCHRQGDPSCTYIESMGCGLAIAGYDNEMWGALCRESGGGWVVPTGNVNALADLIAGTSREALATATQAALRFARAHDFESEFAARMSHLSRVAARFK